jgi:amidohydrolase
MASENRVIEFYDALHQIPEMGFQEEKTSAYLAEKLESFGYEVSRGYGGTGVVGVLKGKMPGPVVGLRADMDALGHEIDGEAVAIHSCGHDSHCAMVLAAAEQFAETGIERGTLEILFQPAEETLFGASRMIADGAGKNLEMLFGIHLRPGQEAKMGEITPALHHGASYVVKAYIEGRTAHGARPHLGINAIHGASAVIQAVLGISPDPVIPSSVKATQIKGGGPVSNAIPASAEVTFDVRSRSNQTMEQILTQMKVAIEQGATAVGATGKMEIVGGVPAAEYDQEMIELAKEAIIEAVGEKGLMDELITPGGEDFHFFTQKIPGLKTAYLGLGCDLEPGLHDPNMSFNKEALKDGVRALVLLAQKALRR